MCPNELCAVRLVVKSIDSEAISDIFLKTIRDFVAELTRWRKNGGGTVDYNQTAQVIASKFPQVGAFLEQEQEQLVSEKSNFGLNRDIERSSVHSPKESQRNEVNQGVEETFSEDGQQK